MLTKTYNKVKQKVASSKIYCFGEPSSLVLNRQKVSINHAKQKLEYISYEDVCYYDSYRCPERSPPAQLQRRFTKKYLIPKEDKV